MKMALEASGHLAVQPLAEEQLTLIFRGELLPNEMVLSTSKFRLIKDDVLFLEFQWPWAAQESAGEEKKEGGKKGGKEGGKKGKKK